jgi:hypothetical protein
MNDDASLGETVPTKIFSNEAKANCKVGFDCEEEKN